MNIVQSFYDSMAASYDKLFADWKATTHEQALILDQLFRDYGFDRQARILDCACGIGTQAIGVGALGYTVTATDISEGELAEARLRAAEQGVEVFFACADFRGLESVVTDTYDVVMAMDNALPHMLSHEDLASAVGSITGRLASNGIFVASIRDYDALRETKPSYSPPYIHQTAQGQRVCFQTWHWEGDIYRLTQYIIEDGDSLEISKFDCAYRATQRQELTELLLECGCREVEWKFPQETGFYQPIVVARK